MNRILIYTLALLVAGLAPSAESGTGKSKSKSKSKKSEATAVEKVDESKTKGSRKSRRPARKSDATAVAPVIQTGTGAPAPGTEPKIVPAGERTVEQPLRVTGKIVYGDTVQVRNVAIVDVQQVFAAIPAYRKIKAENVPKHKARYHILVSQANQEFQSAVQAVALHGTYDLVVEKGGVQGGSPTDITKQVLARVGP